MNADDFLGLRIADDATRSTYELAPHISRMDGNLYGGTALGASLQAFEAATDRPALWCTTQFSATAPTGVQIEQTVEVVGAGHNVSQLRLHATVDGELLYSSLGATGRPRTGPAGDASGTGPVMPDVPAPQDVDASVWHAESAGGFTVITDFRQVEYPPDPVTGEGRPGRLAMWARLRGATSHSAASLAFLADMIPIAICHAAGVAGAGTSLDNTLRVGHLVDSEWVLLDLYGHIAHGGYGHGSVLVWSEDGVLMASGSQTSPLIVFPGGWPEGHGPS